jgi:DNA repair exonuclease SbcCD ATPase subunit
MKFPKLEIENFLAITKAEINLADRGLIAIQGLNKADTSADSNGAGKSSIADALCWCWFGTTARGASGDDVINNTVGKGCRVSSTIIDGGITYTATRHRKHKTGKNSLKIVMHDGLTETDLTKGTDKLTQEVANQIIGSSLEVFAGSIYAGQEKMPDLPAMTDKALKMLIEEAAGVTLLEDAYKKAREGAQLADTQHANAVALADRHRASKAQLETAQATNNINIKTWEDDRTERVTNAGKEVTGIVTAVKTVDLEIKAFDPGRLLIDINAIDKKIAGVADENTKLGELQVAVTKCTVQRDLGQNNAAQEEKMRAYYETQIAANDSKLGEPCPTCARPLTADELAATKSSLQEQHDGQVEAINKARRYEAEWQTKLDDAIAARDRFKAGMTDISAEQMERQRLDGQYKAYEAKVAERNVLMTRAKALKEKIETLRAEVNPYAAVAVQLEKDLEKIQKELEDAALRVKAAEKQAEVEREVVRVFAPSGVRARILDEVTPFLNAQTSKYLSTLSDGNIAATWSTLTPAAKKGEFKEKFSIDVANATGGGSFKTLSGGEKRKVRISTALALQDLVATRASKPIDLFIGDEIDDALDPAGLERLMLILDEKAKERGSVFVISHNELSDHIRQTLTIEKLPGGETKVTEMVA